MKRICFLLAVICSTITISAQVKCGICNGYGKLKCNMCNGYGQVQTQVYNPYYGIYRNVPYRCTICAGCGAVICKNCGGYGAIRGNSPSFGNRTYLNMYRGNCTNYSGGHPCGHSPAAHGL